MTRYSHSSRNTLRINSAAQIFTRIFSLALFSLFVLITTSCEKGILKLGTDLLPDEDFVAISSIDTLSIFSYTMYDKVVRSDNPALSYLGEIHDPVFGTTKTDFVTQLRLNSRWPGGNITIDSVYLYWHVLSTSGGTSLAHTIRLTEISDMIYPDSVYYSDKKPNLTSNTWGNIEIPAGISGDTSIAMKLPDISFGTRIFDDPSQLFYEPGRAHFNPAYPDFRSYFKGLYVQMEPSTDPLLLTLYVTPPINGSTIHGTSTNFIAIYYTDSTGTAQEYDLIFDADARNATYNRASHDFTTANPALRINHINDNYRDTLSYLQYLDGVYTKLVLPGLEKLKTEGTLGRIGINKARLVVPVHFTDSSKFISNEAPLQLVLRYVNDKGTKTLVPDYVMGSDYYDTSHQFFDGTLDSVNKVYNFNIPQFVQSYLEGSSSITKPELEIYQGSGTRNVVFGANNSKTPVKFEFTYTKF